MKTVLSSLVLVLFTSGAFCTTWTITNSGTTFSPSTITIIAGDDVTFSLATIHNAVEVSQETWNVNGSTKLTGGFETPFGGGQVLASQLGVGTHYYVCTSHISLGMKGKIIVQNATGITENRSVSDFSIYPNPALISVTIKANEARIGSGFYISDLTGKKVVSGKLDNEITTIDISHLTRGIYMIGMADRSERPVKLIKL
ncbi:MAG: T9SS type A sorting domain-containing protein [Bacteroidales bacterium]